MKRRWRRLVPNLCPISVGERQRDFAPCYAPRIQRLAPPTIADLLAERVEGARVWCLNRDCQHYGVVPFETIGEPAGFTFVDLPKTRRFVCRECGARDVQVMPDWPPYRARGDEKARSSPAGLLMLR